MELQKVLKFLEHFSVITVGDDKVPNFSWKKQQSQKLTPKQLSENFNYQGGKTWQDSEGITREIKATKGIGICTGFEHLEVLDIDLKVFSTAKEQREFWEEFKGYLNDNILDFDEKFCIAKTKSAGYHILYKTKRVEGNLKLAKLKGHKEAVIETRGVGGYVFVYPENVISKKSYFEIDYISDNDREVLFSFSRMYDYKEEIKLEPKKEKTEYATGKLTPWQDFNERNSVLDIVQSEFTIVSNLSKKIVIKRHGADSAHSGYIFKDSGCMYLFSTGTIYPHETLITAFIAYTYKHFNGDFNRSASELYKEGYGSRIEKKTQEKQKAVPANEEKIQKYLINEKDLVFPVDIFPKPIQSYILECNEKLSSNIDYMGCSMLWLISVSVGNTFEMEVKSGWIENPVLWISLVGHAGIGKTPSINNIIAPLIKINQREIKKYYKKLEEFEQYSQLTKKEQKEVVPVDKPKKSQFIANDITLEALVDLHQESDNAVGVFKDELAGWLKDMNKYRAGSDLEFWLSCWSGKAVNLNRMTRKGSYVDKPFIPVLGGIQPGILSQFYTEENKDNGFMDRMLLSYPDAVVEEYNENEISYEALTWYKDSVIGFFDSVSYITKRDKEGNIAPVTCRFTDEAKAEWIRIFNQITSRQNSDDENEYLKSMYPKQKTYIPRFAILIHLFDSYFNGGISEKISKESLLKAERLSRYFVETAKKVKKKGEELNKLKSLSAGNPVYKAVEEAYNNDPEFNRSSLAEILGVSRRTIIRHVQDLQK
jgi:hypothetical protein